VWCRQCGWNIEPHRPRPPATFTEATRARMSRWLAASVLGEVTGSRRSFGLYRALTYAYALCAYLALAGCFLLGVALIVLTWLNPFAIVAGVVLIGMAYVVFPRPAPMPEIVDRDRFAHLYELADQVADALGAHRVYGIAVDGEFNASYARYGWRARRVMTIGLPMFTVLDGQERVALVAHEIAHDVNRDPHERCSW
jgi:Zn-dependent protease with chaperone function